MKPEISEKRPAQGRVELWTPWGALRLPRARNAAKAPPVKPQPGPWLPPAATGKADRKPRV